jgi:aspartate ammonia-lyase
VRRSTRLLRDASEELRVLGIGGTATGTGINTPVGYRFAVVRHLAESTSLELHPSDDLREAMQSQLPVVAVSAAMRNLALELTRITNDLRLLASGPITGLAEIILPAVQPGSSIMPGKVNPSVPEMVNQVCYQVIGCDAAILAAADGGQLELNVMMPVIAWNALHATRILGNAMRVLDTRCVAGIRADEARCRELLDRSTAIATALSPYIGYAETADIAKTAVATGRSIRELVLERRLVEAKQLDAILAVEAMTTPGVPGQNNVRATKTSPGSRARARDHAEPARKRGAATTPARTAVPAAGPRPAGRSRSGRVAAARPDHGLPRDRGRKRRR